MADVVAQGAASTSPDADHTITVSVDGLTPATTYWYRFEAGGERSPVGRTRTLPDRRRDGVPHRDRLLRRLRRGAARRLPRRRRARGGPGAPPRRLHLREGGIARRPPSRPTACGDDPRRLPATDRPGALGSRRPSPPPTPSDDHHLGRPRSGRQRLARWRQGPRPRRSTEPGPTGWRPPPAPGRSGSRLVFPPPHDPLTTWRSVVIGDLAELLLLDTRLQGRDRQAGDEGSPGPRRPEALTARSPSSVAGSPNGWPTTAVPGPSSPAASW